MQGPTRYRADRKREAWEWWAGQRLAYNAGLACSGLIAFTIYCFLVWSYPIPDLEITLFTIGIQAIGGVVMMGIANLRYCLGPVLEQSVQPRHTAQYRRRSFGIGCFFSFSLPLVISLNIFHLIVSNP